MSKKSLSYDLYFATPEEAEILNEKMDLFNSKQLSFHGKVEESGQSHYKNNLSKLSLYFGSPNAANLFAALPHFFDLSFVNTPSVTFLNTARF